MSATNCLLCGQLFDANLSQTDDRQLCVKCERHESAPTTLGAQALQPNVLIASIAGVASAAIFYAVGPLLLLQNTAINHLFCGHGWIPYACVLLFFVAVWAMLLKLPLLRREASAFALHLLPEEADARLGFVELNKTLDRISRLSRRQRSLLVVTRVRQAVLRLNQLGTAEKLDDLLRYRAETDEASLESSYAAPKFIIWAIRVLGFVGTVLGISNGVQAFSTLIQNASDIDGLADRSVPLQITLATPDDTVLDVAVHDDAYTAFRQIREWAWKKGFAVNWHPQDNNPIVLTRTTTAVAQ